MKKLYLASSINQTAASIAKDIGKDPKKLRLAFISTAAEVENGKTRLKYIYNLSYKYMLLNDYQFVKVENDMYKIVDIRDKNET